MGVRPRDRGWWLLLALVLAAALRLYGIGGFAFWTDEKTSLVEAHGLARDQVSNGPFTKALLDTHDNVRGVLASNLVLDGGNGILYIELLHGWAHLFSNDPVTLRMLSFILGMAVVFATYRAVLSITGDRTIAIVSGVICAASPMFVVHSQDCRTYALATLLTVVATAAYFRLLRAERLDVRMLAVYVLCASLSLFAHYSTVYVLLAHAAIAPLQRIPRWKWGMFIGAAAAVAVILVVWMWCAGLEGLEHIRVRDEMYRRIARENPDINTFFNATSLRTVVQGGIRQLMWSTGNAMTEVGGRLRLTMLSFAIPLFLIMAGFLRAERQLMRTVLVPLSILASSGTLYAVVLANITGHTISFQSLYANFSTPWMIALLACCSVVILRSYRGMRLAGFGVLAAMHVLLIAGSLRYVYSGYHGPSTARIDAPAERINAQAAAPHAPFRIVYGEPMTAMLTNVYLSDPLLNTPQVLDTLAVGAIELEHAGAAVPEIIQAEALGTFRSMAAGVVPLR